MRVIGSGDDYGPGKSGYKGFSNTTVKVGRQRSILDNARYAGNVGYSADTWKTDTDKLWLWGQLKI